ncbi:uncharacterized protein LOC142564241 [Dermacentor variabilis]|uniref:uncharacterized protein LOC142564241 n=1 Tax=Dermacentor variabilis TaxID=34621 RepID=UPI003F5BAE78
MQSLKSKKTAAQSARDDFKERQMQRASDENGTMLRTSTPSTSGAKGKLPMSGTEPRQRNSQASSDEQKKEKTKKKLKGKESKQELMSQTRENVKTKGKDQINSEEVPWYEFEEDKEGRYRKSIEDDFTREKEADVKDSWDVDENDEETDGLKETEQANEQSQTPKVDDVQPQPLHETKKGERHLVLSKLGKAVRAIMKALIKISTISGGNEEVVKQIDSILSERSKMKNIIIEQGQEISYQEGRIKELEKRVEDGKKIENHQPAQEDTQKEATTKPSYALVVTSDNMGKKEVETLIKKKIDPLQLGIRDATMKAGREGVILTTTSKEASTKLQKHMQGKVELKNLHIRTPKESRYHIKVIGLEEDMETNGLEKKIIEQNHLQCNPEDMAVKKRWKGRRGDTIVLGLNRRGFAAIKDKNFLNVTWNRCPIFDHIFMPRCTRCAKHGHSSAECQAVRHCVNCGQEGHHQSECENDPYCKVCELEETEEERDHSMRSWECPVYRAKLETEKRRLLARLT